MVTGEIVQGWRERLLPDLPWAKWPKRAAEQWGPWFVMALFGGILVWEDVWRLNDTAYLTGALLALITAGAVTCSLAMPRRFWCRHLCPIGGMNVSACSHRLTTGVPCPLVSSVLHHALPSPLPQGLFAKLSATELRSRQGVCSGKHRRGVPRTAARGRRALPRLDVGTAANRHSRRLVRSRVLAVLLPQGRARQRQQAQRGAARLPHGLALQLAQGQRGVHAVLHLVSAGTVGGERLPAAPPRALMWAPRRRDAAWPCAPTTTWSCACARRASTCGPHTPRARPRPACCSCCLARSCCTACRTCWRWRTSTRRCWTASRSLQRWRLPRWRFPACSSGAPTRPSPSHPQPHPPAWASAQPQRLATWGPLWHAALPASSPLPTPM